MMMSAAGAGIFAVIWGVFFLVCLGVTVLSIYTMFLLIKALKIYIAKNSKKD